jgi:hypothetical protein
LSSFQELPSLAFSFSINYIYFQVEYLSGKTFLSFNRDVGIKMRRIEISIGDEELFGKARLSQYEKFN